jgi:ketosteroid isomerase-like protein
VPAATAESPPSAEDALRAYRAAERKTYDEGSHALFDNIAPDAVLILNGATTLRGREAVRQFFAPIWAANKTRIVELVDEQVTETGRYIIVTGHFSLEITPRLGGPAKVEHGRYLSVFIRTKDGGCQLWREATVDWA